MDNYGQQWPSWSATFNLEVNETMAEFLKKMDADHRKLELLALQRIRALFSQYIHTDSIEDKEAQRKVNDILLRTFSVGYQLGYNDHASATMEGNK